MINFRFHIISLTAVFLSFAVGLVLGTNFLADASKDYLSERLDDLEHLLNNEQADNDDLRAQVGSLESEDDQLDDQARHERQPQSPHQQDEQLDDGRVGQRGGQQLVELGDGGGQSARQRPTDLGHQPVRHGGQ